MPIRTWIVIATVWILTLVSVATFTHAQVQVPPLPAPSTTPQNLVTGSDIGFQVEGRKGRIVMGRWMVRIGGQWLPIGGSGVVPLETHY